MQSKKLFSLLLAVVFTLTQNAGIPSVQAARLSENLPLDGAFLPRELSGLRVPSNIGTVEDIFQGEDRKTVILIQDAHAIPAAQRNIRNLIDFFQKTHGIHTVALEGAAGLLDPQIFRSFPDKAALRGVFEDYLQDGELTGITMAAVFNGAQGVYRGVEDWELYERGYGLYMEALERLPTLLEMLAVWDRDLQMRKEAAYAPQLLEVDRLLRDFRSNYRDLTDVLKRLEEIKAPPEDSELALMLEESRGSGERPASVEREVMVLAKTVRRHLETAPASRQALMEFNRKQQQFQTSSISAQEFALFLKELSASENIRLRASAGLMEKVRTQKRMRDIEGTRFFEDFRRYAAAVKASLYQDERHEALDKESEFLEALEQFARLEITYGQWGEIREAFETGRTAAFAFIAAAALRRDFAAHIAFYENTVERDDAFVRNLEGILGRDGIGGRQTALFVAGGFHTEGLARRLREKGISHMILRPVIDTLPAENRYKEQMRGTVSWRDYFEIEEGRINIYKAFVRATRERLLAAGGEEAGAVLKKWRDQIIRDLAAQNRILEVPGYTRFIDERTAGDQTAARAELEFWDRLEKFSRELRELEAIGQLTEQNLLRILRPSNITSPYVTLVLANGQAETFRIRQEGGIIVAEKRRSEMRADEEPPSRVTQEVRELEPNEAQGVIGRILAQMSGRGLDRVGLAVGQIHRSGFADESWADATADYVSMPLHAIRPLTQQGLLRILRIDYSDGREPAFDLYVRNEDLAALQTAIDALFLEDAIYRLEGILGLVMMAENLNALQEKALPEAIDALADMPENIVVQALDHMLNRIRNEEPQHRGALYTFAALDKVAGRFESHESIRAKIQELQAVLSSRSEMRANDSAQIDQMVQEYVTALEKFEDTDKDQIRSFGQKIIDAARNEETAAMFRPEHFSRLMEMLEAYDDQRPLLELMEPVVLALAESDAAMAQVSPENIMQFLDLGGEVERPQVLVVSEETEAPPWFDAQDAEGVYSPKAQYELRKIIDAFSRDATTRPFLLTSLFEKAVMNPANQNKFMREHMERIIELTPFTHYLSALQKVLDSPYAHGVIERRDFERLYNYLNSVDRYHLAAAMRRGPAEENFLKTRQQIRTVLWAVSLLVGLPPIATSVRGHHLKEIFHYFPLDLALDPKHLIGTPTSMTDALWEFRRQIFEKQHDWESEEGKRLGGQKMDILNSLLDFYEDLTESGKEAENQYYLEPYQQRTPLALAEYGLALLAGGMARGIESSFRSLLEKWGKYRRKPSPDPQDFPDAEIRELNDLLKPLGYSLKHENNQLRIHITRSEMRTIGEAVPGLSRLPQEASEKVKDEVLRYAGQLKKDWAEIANAREIKLNPDPNDPYPVEAYYPQMIQNEDNALYFTQQRLERLRPALWTWESAQVVLEFLSFPQYQQSQSPEMPLPGVDYNPSDTDPNRQVWRYVNLVKTPPARIWVREEFLEQARDWVRRSGLEGRVEILGYPQRFEDFGAMAQRYYHAMYGHHFIASISDNAIRSSNERAFREKLQELIAPHVSNENERAALITDIADSIQATFAVASRSEMRAEWNIDEVDGTDEERLADLSLRLRILSQNFRNEPMVYSQLNSAADSMSVYKNNFLRAWVVYGDAGNPIAVRVLTKRDYGLLPPELQTRLSPADQTVVGNYVVLPEYQNQRIAPELIRRSFEYLQNEGIPYYLAKIDPRNDRSERAMRRATEEMGLSMTRLSTPLDVLIDLRQTSSDSKADGSAYRERYEASLRSEMRAGLGAYALEIYARVRSELVLTYRYGGMRAVLNDYLGDITIADVNQWLWEQSGHRDPFIGSVSAERLTLHEKLEIKFVNMGMSKKEAHDLARRLENLILGPRAGAAKPLPRRAKQLEPVKRERIEAALEQTMGEALKEIMRRQFAKGINKIRQSGDVTKNELQAFAEDLKAQGFSALSDQVSNAVRGLGEPVGFGGTAYTSADIQNFALVVNIAAELNIDPDEIRAWFTPLAAPVSEQPGEVLSSDSIPVYHASRQERALVRERLPDGTVRTRPTRSEMRTQGLTEDGLLNALQASPLFGDLIDSVEVAREAGDIFNIKVSGRVEADLRIITDEGRVTQTEIIGRSVRWNWEHSPGRETLRVYNLELLRVLLAFYKDLGFNEALFEFFGDGGAPFLTEALPHYLGLDVDTFNKKFRVSGSLESDLTLPLQDMRFDYPLPKSVSFERGAYLRQNGRRDIAALLSHRLNNHLNAGQSALYMIQQWEKSGRLTPERQKEKWDILRRNLDQAQEFVRFLEQGSLLYLPAPAVGNLVTPGTPGIQDSYNGVTGEDLIAAPLSQGELDALGEQIGEWSLLVDFLRREIDEVLKVIPVSTQPDVSINWQQIQKRFDAMTNHIGYVIRILHDTALPLRDALEAFEQDEAVSAARSELRAVSQKPAPPQTVDARSVMDFYGRYFGGPQKPIPEEFYRDARYLDAWIKAFADPALQRHAKRLFNDVQQHSAHSAQSRELMNRFWDEVRKLPPGEQREIEERLIAGFVIPGLSMVFGDQYDNMVQAALIAFRNFRGVFVTRLNELFENSRQEAQRYRYSGIRRLLFKGFARLVDALEWIPLIGAFLRQPNGISYRVWERERIDSDAGAVLAHDGDPFRTISLMRNPAVWFEGKWLQIETLMEQSSLPFFEDRSFEEVLKFNRSRFYRYPLAVSAEIDRKIAEFRTTGRKQVFRIGVTGAAFGQEVYSTFERIDKYLKEKGMEPGQVDFEVHVLSYPDPVLDRMRENTLAYPVGVLPAGLKPYFRLTEDNGYVRDESVFSGRLFFHGVDLLDIPQREGKILIPVALAENKLDVLVMNEVLQYLRPETGLTRDKAIAFGRYLLGITGKQATISGITTASQHKHIQAVMDQVKARRGVKGRPDTGGGSVRAELRAEDSARQESGAVPHETEIADTTLAAAVTDLNGVLNEIKNSAKQENFRDRPFLYTFTNEDGWREALEQLASGPEKEGYRVHLGVSGIDANYNTMAARETDVGILIDTNVNAVRRHEIVRKVMMDSETNPENFASKYLHELKNLLGAGHPAAKATPKNIRHMNSLAWIQDREKFNFIRRMFLEDRILFLQLDLTDAVSFEKLAGWLKRHELTLDTFYVSNAPEWIWRGHGIGTQGGSEDNRAQFEQALASIVAPKTLLLEGVREEDGRGGIHLKIIPAGQHRSESGRSEMPQASRTPAEPDSLESGRSEMRLQDVPVLAEFERPGLITDPSIFNTASRVLDVVDKLASRRPVATEDVTSTVREMREVLLKDSVTAQDLTITIYNMALRRYGIISDTAYAQALWFILNILQQVRPAAAPSGLSTPGVTVAMEMNDPAHFSPYLEVLPQLRGLEKMLLTGEASRDIVGRLGGFLNSMVLTERVPHLNSRIRQGNGRTMPVVAAGAIQSALDESFLGIGFAQGESIDDIKDPRGRVLAALLQLTLAVLAPELIEDPGMMKTEPEKLKASLLGIQAFYLLDAAAAVDGGIFEFSGQGIFIRAKSFEALLMDDAKIARLVAMAA